MLIRPAASTALGCQTLGAHTGERIHEGIAAAAGGVELPALAGAIHVYPTLHLTEMGVSCRLAVRLGISATCLQLSSNSGPKPSPVSPGTCRAPRGSG